MNCSTPGFWSSSLSAEAVSAESREYSQLQCSEQGDVYWVEYCPDINGNNILFCEFHDQPGCIKQVTADHFSVRSRVHEYGGMSWCLVDNQIAFVNGSDQQIYLQNRSNPSTPKQLTNKPLSRFIEPILDRKRSRLIAIEEIHKESEVVNRLIAIDITNGSISSLHQQYDFYAYPTLSNDGLNLAFIAWDHPFQPWVATHLYQAAFDKEGFFTCCKQVAGYDNNEAISQPCYDHSNQLHFISDRNNWWNIYKTADSREVNSVIRTENDLMPSPWQNGLRHYAINNNGVHYQQIKHEGSSLYIQQKKLELPFNCFRSIAVTSNNTYAIAAGNHQQVAVIEINNRGSVRTIRGGDCPIENKNCSLPEPLTFADNNDLCFAYLYPAKNSNCPGSKQDKYPLVIFLHGGPTAATYPVFNPKIQYWTQRGFMVLDLNYRGSSNYGRNYRLALQHQWGLAETRDIKLAITELINNQPVDKTKVFIRGNSSGGFTALNALCDLDLFTAGASLYGVTDPLNLIKSTHKFESHYLQWLIGDPEREEDRYREVSPYNKSDKISCPTIFFQGELDAVVTPDQTRSMVAQLASRNRVEAYYFADEGHGFREKKNQTAALELELDFYQQQLNYD